MDRLAEAEAARFAPSLRKRSIDPAAARQVVLLRDHLDRHDRGRSRAETTANVGASDETILKCLLLAYPDRLVKRRGAERKGVMVGGRGARLCQESVVRDTEFYLALDAREDRRGGSLEVQASLASMVRFEWLEEFFPELLRREQVTRYDESRRCVIGTTRLWYLDLLLREDVASAVDPHEAGVVLAQALRSRASHFIRGDRPSALWLARVDFLKRALPELGWPKFDDEPLAELLERICAGKTSIDEVEKSNFIPVLESRLDRAQIRELQVSAPTTIAIPSGRAVSVRYEPGKPPILSARLQELFGWTETPRVARGRVPVLLELLGPNNRPVQITDDLQSFWRTTYHQVRKDLRGRYPKHAWPEDPLQARPPVRRKPG
jgi:ATP-dependent helicase HrpB